MAESPNRKSDRQLEEEIWTAISAFQQILQAIPSDRASLEALAHAFEQIGDHTQAHDYLVRLGGVLLDEGDVAGARELLPRLRALADANDKARTLVQRIETLSAAPVASTAAAPAMPSPPPVAAAEAGPPVTALRTYNLAQELSMAWNLLEAKEITEEQYAGIVQDLTDMSAKETLSTISVLHVLEGRQFKSLERIINFICRSCGVPFISLSSFDLRPEAISVLPMDFMVRRGAMVFDLLGRVALAVVMNPYDQELRREVSALTGRPCHFFLTLPSEFDAALDKVSGVLVEKSPADAAKSKPADSSAG